MRHLVLLTLALCSGCASYVTPGGPAPLTSWPATPAAAVVPTPRAPTVVALVRVQAADYSPASATVGAAGERYTVVDDPPADALDLGAQAAAWPLVSRIVALPSSSLASAHESVEALRLAAARGQADVLLAYTLDTRFGPATAPWAPRTPLPLGAPPPAGTRISTTASALLIDVRTGYRYGWVHADAGSAELGTAWDSPQALERRRGDTELTAVRALLAAAARHWSDIVIGQTGWRRD